MQELHCRLTPGSEAVHRRSCTAPYPRAVWRCIAGVPLLTAPRQRGSALQELRYLGSDHHLGRTPCPPSWWDHALQEFHCSPSPGGVAVHCMSCTTHCPQAVRQCIVGVTVFRQQPPPGQDSPSSKLGRPAHCMSSTAHRPQAVWHYIAGVALFRQRPPLVQDSPFPGLVGPRIARIPLPTVPRPCGSALQELHWPLPPGNEAVYCRITAL